MNRNKLPRFSFPAAGMLFTTCLPLQAAEEQKPTALGLASDTMGAGFLLQFTAGLVVVLFCVVALAWLMRRVGNIQSSANGALRVIGGLALGTREKLVLVQVGEAQLLIGVAPGRVEAVHVLKEPVNTQAPESVHGGFASRLKEALKMEQPS